MRDLLREAHGGKRSAGMTDFPCLVPRAAVRGLNCRSGQAQEIGDGGK